MELLFEEKVETIRVKTAKDLVLNYVKNAAQTFVIGYAEDTNQYLLCVRFLEGLYGFSGISHIEKGKFTKTMFENNDSLYIDNFDLYSLYVLESDELEFIIVSSIVDYENDDEFGTRYTVNFKEQHISSETLPVSEVKEHIISLEYPRKEKSFIKLN